jgi:hypothetical protein
MPKAVAAKSLDVVVPFRWCVSLVECQIYHSNANNYVTEDDAV